MKILNSILEAIGNTPLVRLNKISNSGEADILVKCEYLNPSGSIKDRIALGMIQEAEKSGKIKGEHPTIVEASTGNTAIAISFVCVQLRVIKQLCLCLKAGQQRTELEF